MSKKVPENISDALVDMTEDARQRLLSVREMIFDLSDAIEPKVRIQESLKWGQPSYAPVPKTGTPIRLGITKDARAAIFVHCQTTLVSDLSADNPHGLQTIDNRAVVLPQKPHESAGLRAFIEAALRYHL